MKEAERHIRSARPADSAALLAIYAPYVRETAVSFETHVPEPAEFRERVEAVLARGAWLVCEEGGEVAGYAYAGEHRKRAAYQWSVEVAVYVSATHQRRGVGRALYGALFDTLRERGYVNAFAGIALPNPASVALHERMGFEPIGVYRNIGFKLGRWHDVGWWALELTTPPAAPTAPR